MANRSPILLPKVAKIMLVLGENIKLACLRRKLNTQQVVERSGISRSTLHFIEKGYEGVSIGHILNVLGLERDLLQVAKDDLLGRKLQDAQLMVRKRAPKRNTKS